MSDLTRRMMGAMRNAAPHGERLVRWWLVVLTVFCAVLEIAIVFDIPLYGGMQWLWEHIVEGHPGVTWAGGMLTTYLLLRPKTARRESGALDMSQSALDNMDKRFHDTEV